MKYFKQIKNIRQIFIVKGAMIDLQNKDVKFLNQLYFYLHTLFDLIR